MLFREREVDNLMTLIYGNSEAQEEESEEDEDAIDCNRYYAAAEKLSMYKDPSVKRKLKSRFVTGQSSDQIVKNLLNMSDDEGEEENKIDKEQLRKLESNDTKVDKRAKRKKRLEARDLKEEESGSEIEDEDEEKEEGEKKPESTVKGHAPLKKTPEEIKKS